ncbi:hypothetical protein [Gallionella capsiferriformans]|uniref:hypothetical protein n=1 Tax=Gallionella capsiferriformans TaxID=370405 RepID=UPI0002F94E6B|nr:hypothetical protein [Gallionella capsiferriformans]
MSDRIVAHNRLIAVYPSATADGTSPPITTVSYLTAIVHPDRKNFCALHPEF